MQGKGGNMNYLEIIDILFYLTPGLLVTLFVEKMTVKPKEKTELKFVIESFIYSMLVYVLVDLLPWSENVSLSKDQGIKSLQAILLFSVCIIISLTVTLLKNYGIVFTALQKLRISRNTSHPTVWNEIFAKTRHYVTINFKDGSRLQGYPDLYSDDPDSPYLYLINACWLGGENKDEEVKLDVLEGILITPQFEIESIEFMKYI